MEARRALTTALRRVASTLILVALAGGCGARTGLSAPNDGTEDEPRLPDGGDVPSRCAATTTIVLAEADSPLGAFDEIELDATHVYVHQFSGTISRVAKGGGVLYPLAQESSDVGWPSRSSFALEGETIAFLTRDQNSSTLWSSSKRRGAGTVIAHLPRMIEGGVHASATGGHYVWGKPSNYACCEGSFVDLDASGHQVASVPIVYPPGLVIDQGGTSAILVASVPGLSTFVPSTGVTGVSPMVLSDAAADETWLYGTGTRTLTDRRFAVFRIDKQTFVSTALVDGLPELLGVAIDRDFVYFGERFGSTVRKVNKGGGDPKVVAQSDGQQVNFLAVDDDCVYWTDQQGTDTQSKSRILAAPK